MCISYDEYNKASHYVSVVYLINWPIKALEH